ncbi:MAG: YegS/Rv2252/BmrU family lipid kinase [Proteobacteria bacterium]|nr:YegS/Rv2252/BmrU family lipid kinase [Pseudomonadota bacterium]
MRVLLLVNPSAGGGRAPAAADEAARVLSERDVAFARVESVSTDDLTRQARAAAESGVDRVVVVGGDGSFHYALNGLVGTDIPVALISCGRGNDFRRNAGLPKGIPQAVDVALDGEIRPLDLIWTGSRYYIGVGGVGFDSEVTECANTQIPLFTGTLAYTLAVFYMLYAFVPKRLRIVHDQGVYENQVMLAVFGNSKSYGGGMKITPEAEMDDGLIDVVLAERLSIPSLLGLLTKVFSGSHLGHPAVKSFRTTRAELTSPDKMELYGDGEYIAPVPVTLEIRPRAVKVMSPRSSA